MISIYALINPVNDQIFYIGATKNPKQRLKTHNTISGSTNKKKLSIITDILSANKRVEMLILEECHNHEAQKLECFYMELFTFYGFTIAQNSKWSNYNPLQTYDYKVTITSSIDSKLFQIYKLESERLDRSISWLFQKAIKSFEEQVKQLQP